MSVKLSVSFHNNIGQTFCTRKHIFFGSQKCNGFESLDPILLFPFSKVSGYINVGNNEKGQQKGQETEKIDRSDERIKYVKNRCKQHFVRLAKLLLLLLLSAEMFKLNCRFVDADTSEKQVVFLELSAQSHRKHLRCVAKKIFYVFLSHKFKIILFLFSGPELRTVINNF